MHGNLLCLAHTEICFVLYVQKQILKEREQAAKWRNVPEWKRALLMKKDQEVGLVIMDYF